MRQGLVVCVEPALRAGEGSGRNGPRRCDVVYIPTTPSVYRAGIMVVSCGSWVLLAEYRSGIAWIWQGARGGRLRTTQLLR